MMPSNPTTHSSHPLGTRQSRGPKKGHLRALETRVAILENRLLEQRNRGTGIPIVDPIKPSTVQTPKSCIDLLEQPEFPINLIPNITTDLTPYDAPAISPETTNSPPTLILSNLLRSELDQLYFERAHPFVPILNLKHYFERAAQPFRCGSHVCLQHAMWTLASSLSGQLQHIRESLYDTTQGLLKIRESKSNGMDVVDIEHIQAMLLLLIYDFMQTNQRRGMMSAGRCFQLIRLMKLSETDFPEGNAYNSPTMSEPIDWIRTEEKRRTFWVAYSLDRFISARHDWPLTLSEQIWTRLPTPEEDFQNGKYVQMPFLSESLSSEGETITSSPFIESIRLAALYGHIFSHRKQSTVDYVNNHIPQLFWERHEWLYIALQIHSNSLLKNYASLSHSLDSILLFTKMMAQTAIIYLCKVIDSIPWGTDNYPDTTLEFKQRALAAAQEIVKLARSLPYLSYFKVHPFTPIPLVLCVDFLCTHRYLDESVDLHLQEALDELKGLTTINNLARDYLS